MTNLIDQNQLKQMRSDQTRTITMPDGTRRSVRMTPGHWDELELLADVQAIGDGIGEDAGLTEADLAGEALRWMEHQPGHSFDYVFRNVVVHHANQWREDLSGVLPPA